VLVRVAAAGICLSDVHLIEGQLSPVFLAGAAVTLGHEVAGTVAELGYGVTGATVGQRVLLQAGEEKDGWVHTRGVDYDGGWAEYALARVGTLVPVPDGMPLEQACIVPDAVSTPWASIVRTAGVRAGQPVGVRGIGGLGAHAVQLLRPAGAVRTLERDGALVLVGLTDQPLSIRNGTLFSHPGQRMLGRYGSEPAHVQELVSLVRHGRLDLSRSISGTLPLTEAARGVEVLAHEEGDPIRLVLTP
jgi:D-arabinose 1-dehydrogenase-like Zn-dependent alcohol dehydrogenase